MILLLLIAGIIGGSIYMHEWWPVIALGVVIVLWVVLCSIDDHIDGVR